MLVKSIIAVLLDKYHVRGILLCIALLALMPTMIPQAIFSYNMRKDEFSDLCEIDESGPWSILIFLCLGSFSFWQIFLFDKHIGWETSIVFGINILPIIYLLVSNFIYEVKKYESKNGI